MKRTLCIALLTILIGGVFFVSIAHNTFADMGFTHFTPVPAGEITSDTTWTQTNSPYNISGPVTVDRGVTLKIEPGTSVLLNGYALLVNGTLQAEGDPNKWIQFTTALDSSYTGSIVFTPSSALGTSKLAVAALSKTHIVEVIFPLS